MNFRSVVTLLSALPYRFIEKKTLVLLVANEKFEPAKFFTEEYSENILRNDCASIKHKKAETIENLTKNGQLLLHKD